MFRWTALLLLAMTVTTAAETGDLPGGYRYPSESDYSLGWKDQRAENPTPFHVSDDFNGDGVKDDAWILLRSRGEGWGLFVFLSQKQGSVKVVRLDTDSGRVPPQKMGLAIAGPGRYATECGKGFRKCAPDEPDSVKLTRPGISLFSDGNAELLYYWDQTYQKFRKASIGG